MQTITTTAAVVFTASLSLLILNSTEGWHLPPHVVKTLSGVVGLGLTTYAIVAGIAIRGR